MPASIAHVVSTWKGSVPATTAKAAAPATDKEVIAALSNVILAVANEDEPLSYARRWAVADAVSLSRLPERSMSELAVEALYNAPVVDLPMRHVRGAELLR